MERLDKVIASCTPLSRRDCRQLVREKRICINGGPAGSFSLKVSDEDEITLDGSVIERRRPVLLVMNKPLGCVTSTSSSDGPSVMKYLPQKYASMGLYPAGRLDRDTSGLLLFTNDGETAHRIISPRSGTEKEYIVTHRGEVTDEKIRSFSSGLVLADGTVCRSAVLIPLGKGRSRVIITEGKYHQVRRMMASVGLEVTALERVRIGRVEIGDLKSGEVREIGFSLLGLD